MANTPLGGPPPTLFYRRCQKRGCGLPVSVLGRTAKGNYSAVCSDGHSQRLTSVSIDRCFIMVKEDSRKLPVEDAGTVVSSNDEFREEAMRKLPQQCTCGTPLDPTQISRRILTGRCGSCGLCWVYNVNSEVWEEASIS